jgi:hypothetical protein
MSKLFKLKKYLTLDEASTYLTNMLEETVTISDIYRLGLDGHLKISINFINKTKAIQGKCVLKSEAPLIKAVQDFTSFPGYPEELKPEELKKMFDFPSEFLEGIDFNKEQQLLLDNNVISVTGIWDLCMVGAESLDIEHKYQQLSDGADITLTSLQGAFVENQDIEDKVFLQLQTSYSHNYLGKEKKSDSPTYVPAAGLPKDSPIVIRTNELSRFVQSLNEEPEVRSISTKSQNKYLETIKALSSVLLNGLTEQPYKDAEAVVSILNTKGLDPISGRKLAEYLKEAPDITPHN